MSEHNRQVNRAVWFDIPVRDLERAMDWYRAVLGIGVSKESFPGGSFAVLEHDEGDGGCLVPSADHVASHGVLIYLNVDGRIRAAVEQAASHGGEVLEAVNQIGPHGYRALVRDSEGNRIALHSHADA